MFRDRLIHFFTARNWKGAHQVAYQATRRGHWQTVLEHADACLAHALHGDDCDHSRTSAFYVSMHGWSARCLGCGRKTSAHYRNRWAAEEALEATGSLRCEAALHAARIYSMLTRHALDAIPYDDVITKWIIAVTSLNSDWPRQLSSRKGWTVYMPHAVQGAESYPACTDAKGDVVAYLTRSGSVAVQPGGRCRLPEVRM